MSRSGTPIRLLLLEHIPEGPPDAYEQALRRLGIDYVKVRPREGQSLPEWEAFDAIMATGGPMFALDDAEHPWLADERRLIAAAVRAGRPYWGVCLGAQLLAAALGAEVRRGPEPEIGIFPVHMRPEAAADPVFAQAPATFETLEWHHDTFDLPAGATLLASSALYPNQAFVWRRAYGVQFHLEATLDVARQWAGKPGYKPLASSLPDAEVQAILADLAARTPRTLPLADHLLERWVSSVLRAPTAV